MQRNGATGNDGGRPTPKRGITHSPKFWLGAALAIVFLVFVGQNHDKVPVHYVFFTKDSYLIWVMVGCGMIGFVVGWLWGRPARVIAKRGRKGRKGRKDRKNHEDET